MVQPKRKSFQLFSFYTKGKLELGSFSNKLLLNKDFALQQAWVGPYGGVPLDPTLPDPY